MAEDVAGNRTVVSEQVAYTLDMTNPTFGNASRVTIAPNANTPNTYDLSCSITLEDENGINFDTFKASATTAYSPMLGLGSHEYVDIINTSGGRRKDEHDHICDESRSRGRDTEL